MAIDWDKLESVAKYRDKLQNVSEKRDTQKVRTANAVRSAVEKGTTTTQNRDSARGAKHDAKHEGVTIQKRTPSRMANLLSGAAKTYAGTSANSLGTVISGTRLARDVDTQQWSGEAARYAHEMNSATTPEDKAYWKMQLDQVSRNIVNAKHATERSDAGAQRVFDTADSMTGSGTQDIASAKAGMGKFGQLMTDVGVAGTQMAADAAIGALTGGGALLPMAVRSFGGGAQEARQSGADVRQQLAYGIGNAAVQVGTEKLLNVATPFKKMFGAGVLDKAVMKATGKLGQSAAGKLALSALGEASEEVIGDLLDPVVRRMTFDKSAKANPEQMLTDALVGGILGLAGGSVDAAKTASDTMQQKATLRENTKSNAAIDRAYDTMRQSGMFSQEARSAVSDAQQRFTGNDRMTQMFIDTLAGKKPQQPAQEAAGAAQEAPAVSLPADAESRAVQRHIDDVGGAERNDTPGDAVAGFDPYSQMQNQTDRFHDDGANAARVVDVPMQNAEGRNIPESAKTIMGAQGIDGDDVRMIEHQIVNGTLAFDTITDEKSVSKAQAIVREKTFDGALEQYRAAAESNIVTKDNTTLGQQLLLQAMRDGNTANVAELLTLYTRNSTTAAQAMQAQAIFRKLSPEGQLVSVRKAVDSFNAKHDTDIEIPQEDLDAFVNAQDDSGRDAAKDAIYKHVAQQVPGTFRAKYDCIRYLSMLGNPRTHIRNILGNTLFQIPAAAKNRVGGLTELVAKAVTGGKYERTKSATGVLPTSQLAKECRADWVNAKDFLSHGSKYNDGNAAASSIEAEQKAFKDQGIGKVINKASEVNGALLEAEDTAAKKFIYTQSLAGYLKANGVKSVVDADAALLNRARSYAAQEALRNTFNDTNSLSSAVSKLNGARNSDNPFVKLAGYGVEGVLPFKKTPANILMRSAEYSPAGVVMGAIDTIRGAKSSDSAKAAQGLDRIASGITGSALMFAGALAAGAGYVTGGDDEDKKQQDFNELTGHQNYALELKNGTSITLDWLAPEAIPFFMGVQLQKGVEKNGMDMDDLATVLKGAGDPMLEMSMLQGLNDVLDNAAYAKQRGGSVGGSIVTSALTNYVTQVFPTVFGQAERAGDAVRETTYVDKNSKTPEDLQYLFGKIGNKLPGVDYHQIPYIDAWGRDDDQGNAALRTFNNVLNPAYVSEAKIRPVEKELQRLADKTGETGVFPQRADKSITYSVARGDETESMDKDLTASEYTRYAKNLGRGRYDLLKQAISSGYYKSMSDAEKSDYVGDLYKYAKAQAVKSVASGAVHDKWIDAAKTAQQDIGVSTPEYIALHEKYGSALVGESYEKVKKAVKSGISVDAYMGVKQSMDANGNGSTSQAEAQAALDASGLSREQKNLIWKMQSATWKKNPYA